VKTIIGIEFHGYGAHFNTYLYPYLVVACAIGMTKADVDTFVRKLQKIFTKVLKDMQKSKNVSHVTETEEKKMKKLNKQDNIHISALSTGSSPNTHTNVDDIKNQAVSRGKHVNIKKINNNNNTNNNNNNNNNDNNNNNNNTNIYNNNNNNNNNNNLNTDYDTKNAHDKNKTLSSSSSTNMTLLHRTKHRYQYLLQEEH